MKHWFFTKSRRWPGQWSAKEIKEIYSKKTKICEKRHEIKKMQNKKRQDIWKGQVTMAKKSADIGLWDWQHMWCQSKIGVCFFKSDFLV